MGRQAGAYALTGGRDDALAAARESAAARKRE
jgi:hypothetical protein